MLSLLMMFGMGSTNVYAAQPDETNTTLNVALYGYVPDDFACKLIEINKKSLHQNPYKTWIQNYANKKTYLYIQEKLEEYSNKQKCEEIETLQKIFIRSLEYEYLFWDMCYRQTYNF